MWRQGDCATRVHGLPRSALDEDQVAYWMAKMPTWNVALRLTDLIVIDVDNYEHGSVGAGDAARHLAELEEAWGSLPPTMRASSRFGADYDGVSGTRFYRLPPGRDGAFHYMQYEAGWSLKKPGIDLCRRCHRQVLVWPSAHPSGRTNHGRAHRDRVRRRLRGRGPGGVAGGVGAWLADGPTEAPRTQARRAQRARHSDHIRRW